MSWHKIFGKFISITYQNVRRIGGGGGGGGGGVTSVYVRLCPVLFGFYETTDVFFGTLADIDGHWRTWTDIGGLGRTLVDLDGQWRTWTDIGRLGRTSADSDGLVLQRAGLFSGSQNKGESLSP